MGLFAELAGVAIGDQQPTRIAGVINVSPESFFAGSVRLEAEELAERARAMVAEGADFLDVGARSTAPYRDADVGEEEERRRMEWAVGVIARAVEVPISADTQRAAVAAAALAAGARLVNDTSGLAADPAMAGVAAMGEGVILMANESGPSDLPPIDLCRGLLGRCLERAARAGIAAERIVLDPGVGFFRQARLAWHEFDLALLHDLARLRDLGRPLLVGVSRKSFLGALTGRREAAERLPGSLAATAIAVYNGAGVIRTHDVAATRDAARVAEATRRAGGACGPRVDPC